MQRVDMPAFVVLAAADAADREMRLEEPDLRVVDQHPQTVAADEVAREQDVIRIAGIEQHLHRNGSVEFHEHLRLQAAQIDGHRNAFRRVDRLRGIGQRHRAGVGIEGDDRSREEIEADQAVGGVGIAFEAAAVHARVDVRERVSADAQGVEFDRIAAHEIDARSLTVIRRPERRKMPARRERAGEV